MAIRERQQALRVLLINDDNNRVNQAENCLLQLGFDVCHSVRLTKHVLRAISDQTPDVVIVERPSADHKLLASLKVVAEHQPTPVVLFSAEKNTAYIREAVEAGVSHYQVGTIEPATMKPIVEVALAQFQSNQKLRQALTQTQDELSQRRAIEQAKLKVMQLLDFNETQAYEHMRTEAMQRGLRLSALAKHILETS